VLHREQGDQDRERQRQDKVVERRRDELEALHGGKHGNRRRDHAVAIEQRRARDAEQDQNRNLRTVGNLLDQRQQREDSAFAVVVGAHDEDDVFERHHRHQRPEDERDDPKDVGCGRDRMPGGAQRDGKRIERTRADIAEHDADRGEREEDRTALVAQLAAVGRIASRSR